jgi:hypothetical protein
LFDVADVCEVWGLLLELPAHLYRLFLKRSRRDRPAGMQMGGVDGGSVGAVFSCEIYVEIVADLP